MRKWEELVNELGFGLAVIVGGEQLPADFFDSMSFEDWLSVFKAAPKQHKFRTLSEEKLVELGTFKDWWGINSNPQSPIELLARAKTQLVDLGTFADWDDFYREAAAYKDSPCYALLPFALECMSARAETFDQHYRVWDLTKGGSLETTSMESMVGVGTFDDWAGVVAKTPEKTQIRNFAMQQTVKLARTYEHHKWLYNNSAPGSSIRTGALQKMTETVGPIEMPIASEPIAEQTPAS